MGRAALARNALSDPRWRRRAWLVALLLGAPLSLLLARSSPPAALEQPIPFSHRRHVSRAGIGCLFCHASAASLPVAGMPSVELCMTCHASVGGDSPSLRALREAAADGEGIAWARVTPRMEGVRFDHALHVRSPTLARLDRRPSCAWCHGPVDGMEVLEQRGPMDMGACFACHEARAVSSECTSCHR